MVDRQSDSHPEAIGVGQLHEKHRRGFRVAGNRERTCIYRFSPDVLDQVRDHLSGFGIIAAYEYAGPSATDEHAG